MNVRKLFLMLLIPVFFITGLPAGTSAEGDDTPTPPISRGTINKITDIHWGKSDVFPIIATVMPPEELDVYEYDKTWVLVLYDTTVQVGNTFYDQSFYGYVKRSDITCDPALEGDASPKAVTGGPKRKAKKPKTDKKEPSSESTAEETTVPSQESSASDEGKDIPVDGLEEFDWIIRTPGSQQKTIKYQQADIDYRFQLMAEKFGGIAASSDPRFNNDKHNPYAAVGFFSMEAPMQGVFDNMGIGGLVQGSGGGTVTGQASGVKIYIDTGAEDFALVNFTMNFNTRTSFDTSVNTSDGSIKGSLGGISSSGTSPFSMQLKKSGGGYVIVIRGILPDGGDLQFPALLEKFPSDQDRRDAQDADKRRKAAEDKINKELEKMKKAAQKDNNEPQTTKTPPKDDDDALAPLVPSEGGDDALAPLVPTEGGDDPLAPLVPSEAGDDALAPLVPQEGDAAGSFPSPRQ